MANNQSNSKSGGLAIIIMIVIVLCIIGSCSHQSSDGMSDTYHTDSQYRDNVDNVAKTYGTTSQDVDSKINAVANEMNK